DAATPRLSSLQSSGKLTANQVQKIEQRLPQAVDKLVNHKGTAKGTARARLRQQVLKGALQTAADTIHIDRATLVQELRSGKSIADVANEHNVSPDTVSKAIVDAATPRLSSLQSSGKLTANQVQKIEQRLPQAVDKLVNHKGTAKGTARARLRQQVLKGALQTAADTIHIDRATLVQELRSGKSIADVANEHNVSPDTVSKAIVDAATNRLSSLQSSGKLTADQVQKIEQRLPQAVDKLVNHKGTAKGTARARLRQQVLKGALQTAADTIHIDRATLVQELRSGKSIADVANEHN